MKTCFGSREEVEAKRSREVDALIHRDAKIVQRQVKLLLLGEPTHPTPTRLGAESMATAANSVLINHSQADASDLYARWLFQEREGRVADHHLPKHHGRATYDRGCDGGVREPLRVREYHRKTSSFVTAPAFNTTTSTFR